MQNTAVVLAVRNGRAVVLTNEGLFREIADRHYFVGRRIDLAQERSRSAARPVRRVCAIAACLLVLIGTALAGMKFLPWTVIGVASGETAVEYRVNALGEVLSARAGTLSGETVLEEVRAESHEPVRQVMERTLSAMGREEGSSVHVALASRMGDSRQTEKAVADAGRKTHTLLTVQKKSWQEMNEPGPSGPRQDPGQPGQPEMPGNDPEAPLLPEKEELKPAEGEMPPDEAAPDRPAEMPAPAKEGSADVPPREDDTSPAQQRSLQSDSPADKAGTRDGNTNTVREAESMPLRTVAPESGAEDPAASEAPMGELPNAEAPETAEGEVANADPVEKPLTINEMHVNGVLPQLPEDRMDPAVLNEMPDGAAENAIPPDRPEDVAVNEMPSEMPEDVPASSMMPEMPENKAASPVPRDVPSSGGGNNMNVPYPQFSGRQP